MATKQYRLKFGKHWYRNERGEKVLAKEGDLVSLTEGVYNAFKDKFELPDAPKLVKQDGKPGPKQQEAEAQEAKKPAQPQPQSTPAKT